MLHVSPSLMEMSRSFGASPLQRLKIVLLAALPEILAGVRLGVIRGVKGVVIGQLLVSIIGVGALFALYSQNFLMAHFWALILILFGFALASRRWSAAWRRAWNTMPAPAHSAETIRRQLASERGHHAPIGKSSDRRSGRH